MSGALSKRQQARNEKVLQELVHDVAGNNMCADCHARNPAWASWSLGVFLCMRCAAIHRKLGTHISKVKSLSMDSWSNEQVDNMRKVGNATSNKIYNPQNKKPPVPIDADEADSAMERFIRQKYMNNSVASARRHDTGSTESDETPPPLPPKTPSRFGFRSASSIFPLSSRAKRDVATSRYPPPAPADFRDSQDRGSSTGNPVSPRNKASKVFGASIQTDSHDDTERKLAKIRDMGFYDDQRNAMVLRGMNGNLEKTIEALIRLGEGDGRSPTVSTPREGPTPWKRSLTPGSSLSVPQPGRSTSPSSPATSRSTTNPFEMLDMPPAQPQSSQSTGTLQTKNPYNTTNPFGVPQQQNLALDQALQGMSLGQSQPLFPNHTGGLPVAPGQVQGQQAVIQPQMQQGTQLPYQQPSAADAVAAQVQQNMAPFAFNSQTYPPPVQQPMQTGYNPFFASAQQQQQQQQQSPQQALQQQPQASQPSLSVNTSGAFGPYGGNPFMRSPTRIQSPSTLTQIPEQAQQNFYSSPASLQQPWASTASPNAYSSPAQNNPFLSPAPTAAMGVQPPRPDTASIMALFNYPQLAPQPFQPQPDSAPAAGAATGAGGGAQPRNNAFLPQHQQPQQQLDFVPQAPARSMTSPPAAVSKNPFLVGVASSGVGAGVDPATAARDSGAPAGGRSRDSVLALGMEWSNGRHSPDAFASLSARDTR